MFRTLESWLKGSARAAQPRFIPVQKRAHVEDQHLLYAYILLEAARADHELVDEELTQIVCAMKKHFKMGEHATKEMLKELEELLCDEARRTSFLERLKDLGATQARLELLTSVWRVIAADGLVKHEEVDYAFQVRQTLNLTVEQAAFASKTAEKELGGAPELLKRCA
jgi:uncharacterized tellurite resistance protein B-like protein